MESRSARCVRDVDWLHRCGQFWKGRKRREGAYEGPGHPRHFTDDFKRQIVDLSNGEYGKAKGKHAELIDEKMASINRCFPVLHQASVARAAIYCEQGEVKAMASALEAYSRLIGQTVGSRAGLLAEFDVTVPTEASGAQGPLCSSTCRRSARRSPPPRRPSTSKR